MKTQAPVRGADDGIKPGVKRSGTPGTPTKKLFKAREAGDSRTFAVTEAEGCSETTSLYRQSPRAQNPHLARAAWSSLPGQWQNGMNREGSRSAC
ncbi:MAG TPA: hypothetical protein VEW46_11510 [Pyrinomonadaceae bacterium]|nr:hypothetical protein [Pyrinomonadaceae bacterium]